MHTAVQRLFRRRGLMSKMALAALCSTLMSGIMPAQTQQLITGKRISPVGTNTQVGNLPMNVIKSPDGKYAIVSDMGFNQWLSSVDVSSGNVISQVDFGQQPVSNHYGLYYGLVFAPGNGPNYTLYAAMGENQTIAVLNLDQNGNLTLINTNTFAVKAADFPSGLAVDSKGNLYVANNDPDTFAQSTSVAIYNPAGTQLGRYVFSGSYFGTPNFPLAIAALGDGSKTYVGSQRDGAVYVLNTSDPTNPTLVSTLNTGSHPAGLTLNQAQSLLYVANAHSDTISVVSTTDDTIASTLSFKVPRLENFIGATPLQTSVSPDGTTLYAAMSDLNAIAVASINGNTLQLQGYIPVGWYPSGVVVSNDNKRLLVTNAKGVTSRYPNPCYMQYEFNSNPCYDLNLLLGTVASLAVPSTTDLAKDTQQVLANNGAVASNTQSGPNDHSLDAIGLKAGKIKHVIYIIKENRTYDQVLGDIPQGNGDPNLVLFGQNITPSLHALATRFVLLDNFYDNGEASGDGWPWSTEAMGSEYVIKNLPYNYSNRGRQYDFEGQDNGYPVGGFPPTDPYGQQLSQVFPNGLPAIPDVNVPPSGHIWDAVRNAGLSYRNYGFFYTFGVTENHQVVIPDNFPADGGIQPAGHDMGGISDYDFRRYDAAYADSEAPMTYGCPYSLATYGHYNMPSRVSEFRRELNEYLTQDPTGNSVPNFITLRLMHDHTQGLGTGKFTPQAEVADNDFGVGQVVDILSKSVLWQNTAIFVIEDDSQDGPDHVDAHRSTAYVISPYIKQGYVDHTFYNTDSILKTMEMLLGVTPMNQYDGIASPIVSPFDKAPNNSAPFTATAASQDIMCSKGTAALAKRSNPMHKWAVESAKMNFDVPDSAASAKLNQVLWHSVKGPNVAMPTPRHNVIPADKDDDDAKSTKKASRDADDAAHIGHGGE
jgi:DNA-binding beta-propeller fold protein YncE